MTDKNVLQLHSLLRQYAIQHIVTSPGCRQFSLITALEQDDYFKLYSVVDERSAAFFALGLIQELQRPVAIMCTSGTACANYTSAVIEAFYQHLPLLILSGDRRIEFLNQQEDQLYDQIQTFKGYTKCQVQLPYVESDIDEWYTNRLVNEAMIELTHHGNGPVHIDYPTVDIFGYRATPADFINARKVDLYTLEDSDQTFRDCAKLLEGKKVAIVWGQSVWHNKELETAANAFTRRFGAVILTDYISNCRYDDAILHTYRIIKAKVSDETKQSIKPDIVISIGANTIFNAEMKNFVKDCDAEFWQVGPEDKLVDGFKRLNRMFEMSVTSFFRKMTDNASFENGQDYIDLWRDLDSMVMAPAPTDFNELKAFGQFLSRLPQNCALQLANSWSTRMTQLLDIRPDIRVNCNRGANGIDGSMSTAVGYSVANDGLTYLCIGDLAFFYDMNSLSIKHVPNSLRIFLVNNQGGSMLYRDFMKEMMEHQTVNHLGIGKLLNAKGWAETCGFEYLTANDQESFNVALDRFMVEDAESPIILEVFTDFFEDADSVFNRTFNDLRDTKDKVKSKVGNVLKKMGLK